jgi:hypothetical protein
VVWKVNIFKTKGKVRGCKGSIARKKTLASGHVVYILISAHVVMLSDEVPQVPGPRHLHITMQNVNESAGSKSELYLSCHLQVC